MRLWLLLSTPFLLTRSPSRLELALTSTLQSSLNTRLKSSQILLMFHWESTAMISPAISATLSTVLNSNSMFDSPKLSSQIVSFLYHLSPPIEDLIYSICLERSCPIEDLVFFGHVKKSCLA